MKRNLFHGIVTNENTFTELICNLFQYESFAKYFINFLEYEHHDISFNIDSQISTNNGRPDILLKNENCSVFIEIKIDNASLTINQPEGYLLELQKRKESNKALFFIIPKNYMHEQDLRKRIKQNDKYKQVSIKYWDDFVKKYKKDEDVKKMPLYKEFYQLIKNWFGYDEIFITKEEFRRMKNAGSIFYKIAKHIENVKNELEKKNYIIEQDYEYGSIGFWVKNEDKEILLWFGSWLELWDKEKCSFVCLIGFDGMHRKKSFKLFDQAFENTKTYKNDDRLLWKYFSLDSMIDGKSGNAEYIANFIDEKIKILK